MTFPERISTGGATSIGKARDATKTRAKLKTKTSATQNGSLRIR